MWSGLASALESAAIEPVNEDAVREVSSGQTVTVVTPAPAVPPTRFGATKVVIEQDPNRSHIKILEFPKESGYADYRVFIMRDISEAGCYYAELITLLATLTDNSTVTVYVGSNGGSLNGGAMIANAIMKSKASVTTMAIGVVASAAALIWSSGHARIVCPGSQVMFHMSSHGDYGNSVAIKQKAENIVRYVKEVCLDPLLSQGLLTAEECEMLYDQRRDVWLDENTLTQRLNAHNG